jgi:hypothetical protein
MVMNSGVDKLGIFNVLAVSALICNGTVMKIGAGAAGNRIPAAA